MKSLALLSLFMLLIGCADNQPAGDSKYQPGKGNLVFKDAEGNIVATGEIKLPDPLPPAGQSFEGKWKLISSDPSFPSSAARDSYFANITAAGIWIDLSPGMADNNIALLGTFESDGRSGKWYHATIVGSTPKGTFEIRK